MTKIKLKTIIDELNDVLQLPEHTSVSALMGDNNKEVCGWCLVNKFDDGSISIIPETTVHHLKEIFDKIGFRMVKCEEE